MAEQQASDSVAPRSKEMVDTMVHADWQSSLDSDQDYQQLEDIVEQYRSTHGVQAIEESKHLITKRFNNKKLRKNPNRLIKQLKAEASKIKKSSSETRENLENDKTERFKTVPSQEIEDLFSNPVFGEKTRNEETVLSHWKQFMTRNCITETQFKSIVQDYNRMSVRPKTVSKRRKVAQNPELNIKPLARRFDYSTKVSQLGSKCPKPPERPKTSIAKTRPIKIPGVSYNHGESYFTDRSMSNSRVGKVPQKELTPEHSLAVVKETEKCSRSIKRRPQSSQLFLVTKKLGVSTTKYRSDFYPENKKLKEEMKQINECMSKSKDRITKRNVQKISVLAAMKSMPHLKPKYESNNKKLVQKIDECYEEAKGVIPPKQLKSMIDSQK